jgi:hypothetical protein
VGVEGGGGWFGEGGGLDGMRVRDGGGRLMYEVRSVGALFLLAWGWSVRLAAWAEQLCGWSCCGLAIRRSVAAG